MASDSHARRRRLLPGAARWLPAVVALALLWGMVGQAAAARYPYRPGDDLIGTLITYRTVPGDTLPGLAVQRRLGFIELAVANPHFDPWLPPAGSKLLLPTRHVLPAAPREGIVINLAEMHLYFFPAGGGFVDTYALGVGREGWDTPLGPAKVVRKARRPTWFPPASIRAEQPALPPAVPPGPDNPLGEHAIYLDWPGYLIHGTNQPHGVGRRVSHGCLRMYAGDVATLFERVGAGVPVTVVQQQAKLGWHAGELYLEVHPQPAAADQLEAGRSLPPVADWELADLVAATRRAAGDAVGRLDVARVWQAVRARRGIPVRVTRPR